MSLRSGIAVLALALSASAAAAQEPLKIGLIQSLTGGFNVGKSTVNGARLYVQQHGDIVAGRRILLVVKDDGASPKAAMRMAEELIVSDKVGIIGAGITPTTLAIASLVTAAKIPTVVMGSGASVTVDRSPYMVRTAFTLGQSSSVMADWALRNGSKRIVTIVTDWPPGLESEGAFKDRALKGGAQIVESMRVPFANPDLLPFLQRARDLKPDTLFVYFPGPLAGVFAEQFVELGLDKSGIRLIGPGDITDDEELPGMTNAMLGVVTAHHYSALHDSALNRSFVKDFVATYGKRPNYVAVAGYDSMHLIYEALKKTGGKTDGDAMLAAMRGMAWESPRGPMSIDPDTRDVVHNEYIRQVEQVNGQLYNVELSTVEAVKDPAHGATK